MGDGDKVGEKIRKIESTEGEEGGEVGVKNFSEEMRQWGRWFEKRFEGEHLGRIVYAGGDDFFGVIFNEAFPEQSLDSIPGTRILEWLKELPQQWQHTESGYVKEVTLSLGFVWAAPSVPQRDILQHCREAERLAKSQGRDRVTIRVLFNSGQYVQWVCPWQYLWILSRYRDLDGKQNWGHIYGDLAQLQARHAFCFDPELRESLEKQEIMENRRAVLEFIEIYFPSAKELLLAEEQNLFPLPGAVDRAWAMTQWIKDLITVGWYLCREQNSDAD